VFRVPFQPEFHSVDEAINLYFVEKTILHNGQAFPRKGNDLAYLSNRWEVLKIFMLIWWKFKDLLIK
jgi:hypothetical protein